MTEANRVCTRSRHWLHWSGEAITAHRHCGWEVDEFPAWLREPVRGGVGGWQDPGGVGGDWDGVDIGHERADLAELGVVVLDDSHHLFLEFFVVAAHREDARLLVERAHVPVHVGQDLLFQQCYFLLEFGVLTSQFEFGAEGSVRVLPDAQLGYELLNSDALVFGQTWVAGAVLADCCHLSELGFEVGAFSFQLLHFFLVVAEQALLLVDPTGFDVSEFNLQKLQQKYGQLV